MARLMDEKDEKKFLTALVEKLGITAEHPNYKAIISVWREQHDSRS
jgi:hypothetical protein